MTLTPLTPPKLCECTYPSHLSFQTFVFAPDHALLQSITRAQSHMQVRLASFALHARESLGETIQSNVSGYAMPGIVALRR